MFVSAPSASVQSGESAVGEFRHPDRGHFCAHGDATVSDVLTGLDRRALERVRAAGRAGWHEPMLATLTKDRFSDREWIFERKLDGVRVIAACDGGTPTLWSRNHKSMDRSYPEITSALAKYGRPRFVADGEIVAFDRDQTSFARLQARIHLTDPAKIERTGVAVSFYLFDLLVCDDYDVTQLPLRARKRVLRRAFDFNEPLRFSTHRNTEGEAYYRTACGRGWEGLIAKRAGSTYRSGRSSDWLKFKCVRDQEFVIGGFTEPSGSRPGLGALLVGYYDSGRLRYAGKVGTGYDNETLRSLRRRLDQQVQDSSPFVTPVKGPAHWVRPELVAQIGFSEWTRDGRLRHPRYQGLRTDKAAKHVVRETP
jgi:bifunctional non-homologous end joining protein LigD